MTDIRALCAELLEIIDFLCEGDSRPDCDIVARARAYLDQPQLEEPTDRELVAVLKQAIKDFPPNHPDAKALDSLEYDIEIELRKARAVLARWGRPAVKPPAKPAHNTAQQGGQRP